MSNASANVCVNDQGRINIHVRTPIMGATLLVSEARELVEILERALTVARDLEGAARNVGWTPPTSPEDSTP